MTTIVREELTTGETMESLIFIVPLENYDDGGEQILDHFSKSPKEVGKLDLWYLNFS